jgi:Reverse transcriptase (RNA-dependent DNA polymerase)
MAILGAHIDDVMLAVPKPSLVQQKEDLLGTFNMHYMRDLHWYTGIKIVHDHTQHTITISQDLYIHNILKCFNMSKAWPTATPMISKLRLEKLDSPAVDLKLYQSMLGFVMYAMIGTQPDLVFAIGYLSHHTATPGDEHLSALKSVY